MSLKSILVFVAMVAAAMFVIYRVQAVRNIVVGS